MTRSKMADTRDSGPDQRGTRLSDSPMMSHLLDALKVGTDIGHYGRLTFVMVARFFMSDDEIVELLARQPIEDEAEARALVAQVRAHDYNPPRREKILAWQTKQEFSIIPHPDDPDSGDVYGTLRFPDSVYDSIGEYYEEKAEADSAQ